MSKEILNKDPRPKCRAHDEYTSQLGGESKTRDPQAGHGWRQTSGRCEEWLPLGTGQTGRLSGARDRVTSRSAPDAKKRNTRTQLHLTHSTTPSTQEFQVSCSHAACTRKTAQHGTPTCARCSCLLFQVLLFPSHPPCVTVRGSP